MRRVMTYKISTSSTSLVSQYPLTNTLPLKLSARYIRRASLLSLLVMIIIISDNIFSLMIEKTVVDITTQSMIYESHSTNTVTTTTKALEIQENLITYLERTDQCYDVINSNLNPFYHNTTARSICTSLLKRQEKFYRLRPEPVDIFNITLLIDGSEICGNDTDLIILIHSLHLNRERRDAIRKTWGGAAQKKMWPHTYLQPNIRVVFVFGVHEKPKEESHLREENARNHDMIQGNFRESYANMTLKSLLGLHWVSEYCSAAKYLFKCDDDMFINIPLLWSVLQATNMTWSIMGPLNIGSHAFRGGKWKISTEDFPFIFYPPYEAGSGYAISADLVRPLSNASNYVPKIFIDDVYITGILGKILRVNHVRQDGFAFWTGRAPKVCDILYGTVLTGTRVTPPIQHRIWDGINRRLCFNMTTSTILSETTTAQVTR